MVNYDSRASLQLRQSSAEKKVKQNHIAHSGSYSAVNRIFANRRRRIGLGEYITLHQALGNDPVEQLQQLLADPGTDA